MQLKYDNFALKKLDHTAILAHDSIICCILCISLMVCCYMCAKLHDKLIHFITLQRSVAMAILSACPSVRLPQAGIVPERIKLKSQYIHCWIAPSL